MSAGQRISAERRISPQAQRAETFKELRKSFPGVTAWHGNATGHWWALVPVDGGQLVEAITVGELHREIVSALAWPWPRL